MASGDNEAENRLPSREDVSEHAAIPLEAHAHEFDIQLRRFAKLVPVQPEPESARSGATPAGC